MIQMIIKQFHELQVQATVMQKGLGGIPVLSDFKIIRKRVVSPTQLKQTVVLKFRKRKEMVGCGLVIIIYSLVNARTFVTRVLTIWL